MVLCIPWFFLCIDVPDHIVLEAVDTVAGALSHLGETLGLGLVLEGVAREIDACYPISALAASVKHLLFGLMRGRPKGKRFQRGLRNETSIHTAPMHVRLNNDIHASDAIERDLDVLVIPPIPHLCHIRPVRLVFLVAFGKDDVLVEGVGQFTTSLGLLPGIVVEAAFDVNHFAMVFFVSMKPDIY